MAAHKPPVTFLEKIQLKIKEKKAWAMPVLWIVVVACIGILLYLIYLRTTLPDPETIITRQIKESTKVYDRTGEVLLYDIYDSEKRTIISWNEIPQTLRDAVISSEDSKFYEHRGIDFRGIIRAIIRDIQNTEFAEGGSTITQQLVKNALLGGQKKISRKLREIMLSVEIERRFSKDEILWMYLNQIPWGSTAYGAEAASQLYFGKKAADLTLNESAILAAMIQVPSYYSPYGKNVDALLQRKNSILRRMKDLSHIDEKQYQDALNEEIVFKPQQNKLVAPHFVIMAREELIKKYGEERVSSGGFKIITTLDAELQKKAEELVAKYGEINKRYRASNAALVAIDPQTGDVLALVGSKDYFDVANEGNFNVATALRQPGSAFKPFAYATAIQKGYTDSMVLFDVRTEFNPYCSPAGTQARDRFGLDCYHPNDYDLRFRGPVTLRQALAQSLNVPSVKMLYLAGINDTVETAKKMGITTLREEPPYGLALVLGGAEVKLVDIVSAYGVFANDGVRNQWGLIQRVALGDDLILEEKESNPTRVINEQVARLINDILSDNSARAPVFGPNSPLYFPGREVAAKTGTTQLNKDAWVVGYTPNLVLGVWVGNNRNQQMTAAGAGISAAGPLWNAFMAAALSKLPRESFSRPNPANSDKVMLNGTYAYNNEVHSILYYVTRSNPRGAFPANPSADVQFANWEWAVQYNFQPPQQTPIPSPPLPTSSPNNNL
ncbi:MAG: transglycosylase domain-containing protein [Patescibacteria group bacterium]